MSRALHPPSGSRARRLRRLGAVLAALLVASLAFAGVASADIYTPQNGPTPNANEIEGLYKIALYIALFVFVGVEGTLVFALIRFRAKPGRKNQVAKRFHGNTRLEIGWTSAAALILVALAIVTFTKLSAIDNPPASGPNGLFASGGPNADTRGGELLADTSVPTPPSGKKLTIDVNGRQYIWRFRYPNGVFAYTQMTVPVNTTVVLAIRSDDVDHSWWIPQLGGKFDAVPGDTNYTWFKISKPGVYKGQCAELCGRNHADMLAEVRALPVAQYRRWVAQKKMQITQSQQLLQQERQQLVRQGQLTQGGI
jgi:cytochrome c oxidase subunit 2